MKPMPHQNAIEKVEKHAWLFDEVVLQIEKDLHMYDEPLELKERNLAGLHDALLNYLDQIGKSNPSHIFQKLYTVDVSEKELHVEMGLGHHDSIETLCAQLIIKREMKKVVFRNILNGRIDN